MRRWIPFLLAAALACIAIACAAPQQERKPDYDAIRQRHQEASQDQRREEDKRAADEDEDDGEEE